MPKSPIQLAELEASVAGPSAPMFLPAEAYTSPEFHEFELETVWRREWVMVGRMEEIPEPGDYFTVDVAGDPLIIVQGDDGEINAVSAVCRHRGMLVAEGRGYCERAFICAYHGWAYDRTGKLMGAPQAHEMVERGIRLPRAQTEVWKGFIFVNLDPDAAPLVPRLAPLEPIVAPYHLEDLRGDFQDDPNYKFESEYPWNWKVYADGQNECYHCDKLHGDTPLLALTDCNSISFGVMDPENGVFQFTLHNRDIDVVLNHLGKSVFGPIPTLTEQQRWQTETVVIAPGVLLVLMPDSVIALGYRPAGPTTMVSKRHRLYPQETLARPDFAELHSQETVAIRAFVAQDDYAFERVQRGLSAPFAPRGPIATREQVVVGVTRWLMDRYRSGAAVLQSA